MNSEQNNYFFVGTKFGDDDYLEYFMKEGKWELGWHNNEENKQYQRMLKLFNKIKPGDVLFAKSTYFLNVLYIFFAYSIIQSIFSQ